MTYKLFHMNRQHARELGDPCLGSVEADSVAEAQGKASRHGIGGGQPLWAIADIQPPTVPAGYPDDYDAERWDGQS